MFFKQPDLTAGSRPLLQPDETLLFVQNSVGLYEGKFKIAGCQNGHAYLTSHRACYIDDVEPRTNSLAIDLRDVERHEHQAGFLRSSPKITLHSKPFKRNIGPLSVQPYTGAVQRLQSSSSPVSRTGSPFRLAPVASVAKPVYTGSWVCPICSFTNPVPSNFDPSNDAFPLAPCLQCGITPAFSVVLKAAIAANASRLQPAADHETGMNTLVGQDNQLSKTTAATTLTCPRCTYHNHPSLQYCEICDAVLPASTANNPRFSEAQFNRTESPGPEISSLSLEEMDELSSVKFSFRAGGDKVFFERLKNAMIQRKWLVTNAPPPPRPLDNIRASEIGQSGSSSPERSSTPRPSRVGIAGLEQRGLQSRKVNETVLGTAFEDLEALMASAREIVALAEKFSAESRSTLDSDNSVDPLLFQSAAAVGMVATKDMLSDGTNKLYVSELARNLAEYITDDRRGILRKQGGVMSLVDLWATFNRARNGVELVSPADFHKATEMWATLGLPVRLRQFKSGLLVVQQHDRSDDKTIAQLQAWLRKLQQSPAQPVVWDWASFGCGVTAQDAAQQFGWSLGVATEELEMAEERGALCREDGVQGLRFWLNYIVDSNE